MASFRSEENVKRLTFSSDLEEAMFETGKSLSAIKKFDSVLEKNQPIYKNIVHKQGIVSKLQDFKSQSD